MPYQYYKSEMTRDGSWLMIALRDTTDRPAPQQSGSPVWQFSDSPSFPAAIQPPPGPIRTGNVFTVAETIKFVGARFMLETVSSDYLINYYARMLKPSGEYAESLVTIDPSTVTGNTWRELPAANVWGLPGDILEVGLTYENQANGLVVLDYQWQYAGTNNNAQPLTGSWNKRSQDDIIRIHNEDWGGTDRAADLALVNIGDLIEITDIQTGLTRKNYRVQNVTQNVTTWEFDVVLEYTSVGDFGVLDQCRIYCIQPGDQSTPYIEQANYWPANIPSWASTAKGTLDGVTTNDNAYAIDVQVQKYDSSPDWDVMAISAF